MRTPAPSAADARSAPSPRGEASTALIIIDFFSLFDFPDGERLAPLAVAAARRSALLRDAFDAAGRPVIYANDNFGEWKRDFPHLVEECRHHGRHAAAIAGLLAPKPGHYFILKPKHSAFLATPLPVLLAKLGVSRLVLAGMALDSCVLATAMDANSREYETYIASDATACLPGRRTHALQTLKQAGTAKVLGSAQVLGLVQGWES